MVILAVLAASLAGQAPTEDYWAAYTCAPFAGDSRTMGPVTIEIPASEASVRILAPGALAGEYPDIGQPSAAPSISIRLPDAGPLRRYAEVRWRDDAHQDPEDIIMLSGPEGHASLSASWKCRRAEGHTQ